MTITKGRRMSEFRCINELFIEIFVGKYPIFYIMIHNVHPSSGLLRLLHQSNMNMQNNNGTRRNAHKYKTYMNLDEPNNTESPQFQSEIMERKTIVNDKDIITDEVHIVNNNGIETRNEKHIVKPRTVKRKPTKKVSFLDETPSPLTYYVRMPTPYPLQKMPSIRKTPKRKGKKNAKREKKRSNITKGARSKNNEMSSR